MRTSLERVVRSDRGPDDERRELAVRRRALLRDGVAAIALERVEDLVLRDRIRAEAVRQMGEVIVQPQVTDGRSLTDAEKRRRAEALFRGGKA